MWTKKIYRVSGFTDLGEYTPDNQKNEPGDRALVLMFQPFRNKWVQCIAAFLSKGAATGTVLCQILMEAVVLLENSGFYVDGIVSDSASWNRSMWKQFGVDVNQPSCTNFLSDDRKLWFFFGLPTSCQKCTKLDGRKQKRHIFS